MTTVKGAATRGRIVDAAADQLISGGAARLNLDDVLRETKTSKGQLFHYFPGGKPELSRAATERHVQRLTAGDTVLDLSTWPAWHAWFAQIETKHEQQSHDDACEVAALGGRALDGDAEARAIIGDAFEHWDEQVRAGLSALQESGFLRRDAPIDELSWVVLAAIQGGAILDKATRSTSRLPGVLHQTLRLLESWATRGSEPSPA
jgi:TetR/AcrR family transcriptional repressor of nem operon